MDGNEIETEREAKRIDKIKLAWQVLVGKWVGVVIIHEKPQEGDAIEVDGMIAIFTKK